MQFNWSPGIGDPTLMGWLTVALYLTAAMLTWRVAQSLGEEAKASRPDLLIWRGLALFLLVLGVNKQLDLQSAFTELGRVLAHLQGWHEQRRLVQFGFIVAVGGMALIAAIVLLAWARRVQGATRLALIGAIWLVGFVVIRAASFHHIDELIHSRVLAIKWNWILEISGIALIILAAWKRGAAQRPRAPLPVRNA